MYESPRSPNARRIAGGGWIVPPAPPPTASRTLLPSVRPIPRLRAVIADADPASRERLRRMLEDTPDIRVVGAGGRAFQDLDVGDVIRVDVECSVRRSGTGVDRARQGIVV
jgi:hypothetical protein